MRTPHLTERKFRRILRRYDLMTPSMETALDIVRRYFLAKRRDDGTSYAEQHIFPVTHDVIVFFREIGQLREEIVIASLFHDLFEDASFSVADLERHFPHMARMIYDIVQPLTKDKHVSGLTYAEKLEYDRVYFRRLYHASYPTKIIKIFDRINNLSCPRRKPGKQQFYLEETHQYYLPFARNTNKLLYERLLQVFIEQGGATHMFGMGKKRIEYQVIGAELKIKDNDQPSSTYVEVTLMPREEDRHRIKKKMMRINLTLHDLLSLKLDPETEKMILTFLSWRNTPISEWHKEATELFRRIERKLYHHIIEFVVH